MESNHADLQKTRTSTPGKVADIHTAANILARPHTASAQTRLSRTAVRKVFAIKKRPTPVSLAVSGYGMLEDGSVCDAGTMELIRKLRLGPITVTLKKKPVVPDILTAGSDRVGIRYPDHEITIPTDRSLRNPGHIHAPTCQESHQRAGVCEISADVLDGAGCVVDGGRCAWSRFNRCRSCGDAGSSEGCGVRAGCEIPAIAAAFKYRDGHW